MDRTIERQVSPESPYELQQVSGREINLPTDAEVQVEYYRYEAMNLAEAARIYDQFGAVILSPSCKLDFEGQEVTASEAANEAREHVLSRLRELWTSTDRDDIIRRKHYDAYNHTGRDMRTVAYDNVLTYFPGVNTLQQKLLPMVRTINGDPATEVSVDKDEGTVINLQMFDPNGDLASKQEHGAHTDRVDTTAIVCLENAGPQGNLVFIQGYTDACVERSLDPHQDFNDNIGKILADDPQRLLFRVHRIKPDTIVLLHTDQDVHYITPKTLGDVKEGEGSTYVDEMLLGRGIINMAFETQYCRDIDTIARTIEEAHAIHGAKDHTAFFERLDAALAEEAHALDEKTLRLVRSAIITRLSAEDLYT